METPKSSLSKGEKEVTKFGFCKFCQVHATRERGWRCDVTLCGLQTAFCTVTVSDRNGREQRADWLPRAYALRPGADSFAA